MRNYKGMYIHKKDVTPEVWETLCEDALGYPIREEYELLDVVLLRYINVSPCESKSSVNDDGTLNTIWIEKK